MCLHKKENIQDIQQSLLPMIQQQMEEECYGCRQPCEEDDENSTWQYFPVDGYKYCYACWEELELEKQL